jgi:integrase
MLSRIEAEITLGTFDYAKYFPGSHNATKIAQATASNASGASAAGTPLYGAFAETWYLEGEPLWRRSHKATIRSTLDRHLVPAFGKQGVGEISKADCLAFRARLAKLPGRAGNDALSAKTVNRIMQIHSQILAEASERYGFANPTDRIKRMKQPKVDIHPFSLDEVQRMVDTVRADYRDYLVVRFFTGMRTGEINGLQWRYVDFDQRQILIRETLVRGKREYTKTDGSQRDIAMSQPVFEALQRQQQASGDFSDFVFCNGAGEPIDLDNFTNRVWYPLLRYLELDERRPYQTRHTAATLWLASGENPEWVARQLGHATTEMLFKTYSRYVPNLTRSDGAAMERLLAAHINAGHLTQRDTVALRTGATSVEA